MALLSLHRSILPEHRPFRLILHHFRHTVYAVSGDLVGDDQAPCAKSVFGNVSYGVGDYCQYDCFCLCACLG